MHTLQQSWADKLGNVLATLSKLEYRFVQLQIEAVSNGTAKLLGALMIYRLMENNFLTLFCYQVGSYTWILSVILSPFNLLGVVSAWRCDRTSIGITIIKVRRSHVRLFLIIRFQYIERRSLYWNEFQDPIIQQLLTGIKAWASNY